MSFWIIFYNNNDIVIASRSFIFSMNKIFLISLQSVLQVYWLIEQNLIILIETEQCFPYWMNTICI